MNPQSRPIIIGLIGGIASGKTTVARMFSELGALWIDSDRMAHAVLDQDETRARLVNYFGTEIIGADGQVLRKAVAKRVFGDSAQAQTDRKWLEALVHPRVRQLTEQRITEEGADHPAVVIDAPLLLEAGWAPSCNHILFVDTPWSLRKQLAAGRGWTETDLLRREAAQLSLSEKRAAATDIIENDGQLDQLKQRVDQFWQSIQVP